MEDKAQKALQLLKEGKIKKSLLLSNKMNKQANKQSFLSLEVEGVCLYKLEKYQLAEMVFQKALNKSPKVEEKLNTLKNLVSVAYALDNKDKMYNYLSASLDLDSSIENINSRLQLCQISFQLQKFDTVIFHASKLLNSPEHFSKGILLLIQSLSALNHEEELTRYSRKAISELDLLSSDQALALGNFLIEANLNELIELFIAKAEKRYSDDSWFKNFNALYQRHLTEQNSDDLNNVENDSDDFVQGENAKVVVLIEELVDFLVQNGASFHPKLRVIEKHGNLSIKSNSSMINPEKLMSIPINCMPLLSDYSFKIGDDGLVAQAKEVMLNPKAVIGMELLCKIYNATDKIPNWIKTYPLLALKRAPKLVNLLLSTNPSNKKIQEFNRLFREEKWGELTLRSFIGSREVSYDKEMLSSAGIATKSDVELGLLSLIDFVNHKANSAFYQKTKTGDKLEIVSVPDKDDREVYVQYNISDPVITYLFYGFIDEQAPCLYSIPNIIMTRNGTHIVIENSPQGTNQMQLEQGFQDKFLPTSIRQDGDEIIVNSLVIPSGSSKGTLSLSLHKILVKYDAQGLYRSEEYLKQELILLERQLLKNNLLFWNKFLFEVENENISESIREDLIRLHKVCTKHITAYQNSAGITLF